MTGSRISRKQKGAVSPEFEQPTGTDKRKRYVMSPAHRELVQLLARQAVRTHLREEAAARRRAHGPACSKRS